MEQLAARALENQDRYMQALRFQFPPTVPMGALSLCFFLRGKGAKQRNDAMFLNCLC